MNPFVEKLIRRKFEMRESGPAEMCRQGDRMSLRRIAQNEA
jgi:hypothetical protein